MKVYRGAPAAARHYVEADRSRADDYYLTEGTGIAARFSVERDGRVIEHAGLSGNAYEAWVAGRDPDSRVPRGRVRDDAHAVRFVEVVVNGPKSWSLAAELHPDVAVAYEQAQDRAARQILAWLGQHATTRVGPRGGQVAVPVQRLEAAVVRHYTSRAGDPHRHLHLQVNARVFAAGKWRGLDTVAFRDSIAAVNGIGHAAITCDPDFRAALAGHGYTLNPDGEITQLAPFVGPFSRRAAQISALTERFEAAWRSEHPGQQPGPGLRRAWDARAWATDRPDKIVPRDGAALRERWLTELHELGYRDRDKPLQLALPLAGSIDRDTAVAEVIARLGSARSGWNGADVRGQVEQLLARAGLVAEPAVRSELAEDLTARALALCVPLHEIQLPEHVRALTSPLVVEVEADLVARLAARGNDVVAPAALGIAEAEGLGEEQRAAVAALVGKAPLLVIEGAAGAGKTTTLAATRAALERSGHRLIVLTPTRKAARVAAEQLGSTASSAAWFAHQHGYRWHEDGTWTRLTPGQADPVSGITYAGPIPEASLRAGDLVLCDEAGMCDQDTARALLTIADEHHARLALVGDRHQLPAVGRGGVLELAVRWAAPETCLTLETIHRFTRTTTSADGTVTTVADEKYARLSLSMRAGTDPEGVFDELLARGQIRLHADDRERTDALVNAAVDAIAAGTYSAVVSDTREQVTSLNTAIRDRLVMTGRVDDAQAAATASGQRIGAGDRIVTRRNNADLDVANRDGWTVTAVTADGRFRVAGERGERVLPAGYVHEHVDLGYASTVYGVQGDTVTDAHLAVGEHTSAASAYVGMTRGRHSNIAHLVADNVEDAREQWAAAFARDRADLGPAHAAALAEHEAARYARLRPLDTVFGELHCAWTAQADCAQRLADAERRREMLVEIVALTRQRAATVPGLKQAYEDARLAAEHAIAHAERVETDVCSHANQISLALQRAWDEQRDPARQAARTVRRGPGRLGQRHFAVNRATEELARWSAAWQPYLPTMPTRTGDAAAFADRFDDTARIQDAFHTYARTVAEYAHPEHADARAAAETAKRERERSWRSHHDADAWYRIALQHYGALGDVGDPAGHLADLDDTIRIERDRLSSSQHTVARLVAEPALRAQPAERISIERDRWSDERDERIRERYARAAQRAADRSLAYRSDPSMPHRPSHWQPDHSRGISR